MNTCCYLILTLPIIGCDQENEEKQKADQDNDSSGSGMRQRTVTGQAGK
jgi:hypothetical protein